MQDQVRSGGEMASLRAGAKLSAALGSGWRPPVWTESPGWCREGEYVFDAVACEVWSRPATEERTIENSLATQSEAYAVGWIPKGTGLLYVTSDVASVDLQGTWYAFPYGWRHGWHARFPYLDVHPPYGSPVRLKVDEPHRLKVLIDYLIAGGQHS